MGEFDDDDNEGPEHEAARLRAEVVAADTRWLASSEQGRRVLYRLLERVGVFRTSFGTDGATEFREGMRNVGLMLLDDLRQHAPEQIAPLLTEGMTK